ncbi:MAG: glycosyltransferase family 1 protein, partial [Nitrososphaeraceae archaeon]
MHLRMRRRNNARVLFLLKRREDFNDHPSYSEQGISTGLLNSATFVQQMLLDSGIDTKLSVVLDNNCIDREVTEYRPTHVIIEALWVVPEKFEILRRLHPNVKWIIRFHSETPFIANEGVAMKWIHEYIKHPSVYIAINAPRFLTDVKTILAATGYTEAAINDNIIFLPNYYPLDKTVRAKELNRFCDTVNVCCFGAIRPLKNHLLQAIAALKFATVLGKKLNFHINVGRIEMKGDPILHNLQGLFDGLVKQGHQLTVHTWTSHDKFIEIIKNMDIGLQVS